MKIKWFLVATTFVLLLVKSEAILNVPFDVSMTSIGSYQPEEAAKNKDWRFLKSLYETYQNQLTIREEYIIPKLIHFIWVGSPLPERCQAMIETWRKYHPDWTIKVWTDEDVPHFQFMKRQVFDRAQNYGEKSDVWRYEILYQFGGLYADTDFECLQPFDDLHRSCEFYAGAGQVTAPELINALIGSIPGHPILKTIIDNLQVGPGNHDVWRILRETGPWFFTRMFLKEAPNCLSGTIVTFPLTFFYPFPFAENKRKDQVKIKQEFLKPESMAIHYFAESWMKL